MPTHVSSAPELQAALQSANGGDTILLESGNYGWVNLQNLKFNDPVTIKSADGDGGARFQHITINNSSHITLDSLTVEFGRPERHNDKAIDIRNADHVKVMNSEIIGDTEAKDLSNTARGVEAWESSSNIEFTGNHLHHFARAASFLGVSEVTFRDNLIDNIQTDGLFFGNSKNILVENNVLTDFYRQGTGHADYIQFDPGTSGASRDVVIRGNVMLKGNGNGDVQGIFGASHHAHIHKTVFTNFLIENNIYFDTGLNSVQFYSGDNMIVRNNTVLTDPADGRVGWVRLTGPQTNSVIENNVALQVNAEGGATASGNIIVQYKDPSKPNYYGNLFTDPFATPASLADLAPKAGIMVGYGSGKGAEKLFQELLGGGDPDKKPVVAPVVDGNLVDDSPVDGSPADDSPADDSPADDSPVDDSSDPVLSVESALFNGKGSEMILEHQQSFELTDGALELTFTPESIAGRQTLFSKDSLDYDNGGHLAVSVQDGNLIARLQSTSQSFVVQADNAVSAGDEHHAIVSFGQNGLKLYLNGELVDSNSYKGGLTGNSEPIVLGAGQTLSVDGVADNLNDFFNGSIAGLALYEDVPASDVGAESFLL